MKRCMLCHRLLDKRRWLLLPAALALTLLLTGVLPRWLWLTLLGATLLVSAMLLIYLRDLPSVWTNHHLRRPAPFDGLAEIVMIDASLVDRGPTLLGAAQPVEIVPEMSLRMGGGALLLGAAMLLLAEELPRAAAAPLTAAAEKLNLNLQMLRQRGPILCREKESGMRSVTVQDGPEERTYFVGDIDTVLKACGSIWEERPRLMGAGDHARIRQSASQMSARGEQLYAFATAAGDETPVFLGMAAIGDDVDPVAVSEMETMRSLGYTLVLRDDGTRLMDVPALRRSMDILDLHARPDIHLCITDPYPDKHCLGIIRHEDHRLIEPIQTLRKHFAAMAVMLERLSGLLGLCFLCCVMVGGRLSIPFAAAVMTAAYLSFGSLTCARAIRPTETILTAAACLLLRLLLASAAPEAADAAGSCLCLSMTALLSLTLAPSGKKLPFRALLPVLVITALALTLLFFLSPALVPNAFCIVCGLLIGAAFFFTGR